MLRCVAKDLVYKVNNATLVSLNKNDAILGVSDVNKGVIEWALENLENLADVQFQIVLLPMEEET